MTIGDKIDRIRDLYSVDSFQYKDDYAIQDLNTLIRSVILLRKENWDIGKSDTVVGQSEYQIQILEADENNNNIPDYEILDVEKVFVDYGNGLKRARKTSYFSNEILGSESEPVYYKRDNSVFIYPSPKKEITNGIEIHASYIPHEVVKIDDISIIKLPTPLVDVIFEFGLGYYIEKSKKNYGDAENLRQIYLERISKTDGMIGDGIGDVRLIQEPDYNSML